MGNELTKGDASSESEPEMLNERGESLPMVPSDHPIKLTTNSEFLEAKTSQKVLASELNSIAVMFHIQGNYDAALKNYLKVLSIQRNTMQHAVVEDNSELIKLLQNIASLYFFMNKLDEAKKYNEEALNEQKKMLPEKHADLAILLTNVATNYMEEDKYDEALEYLERSYEIRKKESSSNRNEMIDLLKSMGTIYDRQGRYDEALKFYTESLRLRKRFATSLSSNNGKIDSASSDELLNNIGMVFYKQGKYDDALECFFQTLGLKNQLLAENHREIARSLNNIGAIFNKKVKRK